MEVQFSSWASVAPVGAANCTSGLGLCIISPEAPQTCSLCPQVVRAATIVKDFADRHQPELTCEIGRLGKLRMLAWRFIGSHRVIIGVIRPLKGVNTMVALL